MLRIISTSLKTGILTEARPFDVHPSFGFPTIDFSRCTACDECAKVCPTGAIQTASPRSGMKTVSLSYAACIQCRECVAACPERSAGLDAMLLVRIAKRRALNDTHQLPAKQDPTMFPRIKIFARLQLSDEELAKWM